MSSEVTQAELVPANHRSEDFSFLLALWQGGPFVRIAQFLRCSRPLHKCLGETCLIPSAEHLGKRKRRTTVDGDRREEGESCLCLAELEASLADEPGMEPKRGGLNLVGLF